MASDSVKKWLEKSAKDLRLAKQVFELGNEYLEHSAFLCQQSAEKSMKAFLAHHKVRIKKTHNIQKINEVIAEIDRDLSASLQEAEVLTDFAVKYRYPEAEVEELTEAHIKRALKLANAAFDKIKKETQ